ncbi:MAG: PAS domain S-box protein [Chlorogloeopsis fritschii C42_A2020_084]|uniref:PAS domain S-box protein n=1 Tax=Chlorogloeopsis fritschii TaxID=1124 RepID=UPI0019EEA9BB|nr:PAS domain S-box protein [Chlorogloeopsis fritschii C42_A2020_084]
MTDKRISLRVGEKLTPSNRLLSYGVALLSTALALAIALLLDPAIDPAPTSLFFMAVMVTAWYGGLRPGLVATILSALAINYYFVEPYHSLTIADLGSVVRVGVYVTAALLISGLNESRRIALHREQKLRAVSETAQSEAQAAKERLETVLSSIDDGFYVLDRNWRYTYVSDRYCEMTGMQREKLLGHKIWDLFPDAVDTDFYVQLQRAMTEQTPAQFEYFDATWNHWYEYRVYPSPDGITVLIAEITDRKQTEAALRQSEARFRRIFECNMVSMGIWTSSGGILQANDALLDLVGYTRQELEAGQINWQKITPPEWLPMDDRSLAEIASKGFSTPFEKEYIHKQGHRIPILIGGASFLDDPESGIFFAIDLSDRKQTEAALQESEARFRLMAETIQDVFWITDFRIPQILYVSPAYEQIWGHSPEEIYRDYTLWANTIHPDDRQRTLEIAATCGNNDIVEQEYRIVRPDGNIRWIRDRGFAVRDEAGEIQQVVGIAQDITDYKLAIEALRQSEERLRLAMEGAQMATWDVDLITGKAIWSELHFTMLGYEPTPTGEATEVMWSSRIHLDDLDRVIQEWHQSRQEHRLYRAEYRVIRADNHQISWLAGLGSFTYDQNGEAVRSIGVLFDITDRKQAEVALQQREAELRLVTNAVPALISFVDSNQCYRFNNRAYEEWFGHLAAEIYGKHLREVLGETAYEEIRPYVEQVLAGQQVSFESQVAYKDGGTRYVSATYVPRINSQGTVEGFVALVSDISDRKRAEAALRQSEERYRSLVEVTPQLVWTADAQGRNDYVNQQMCDYIGLPSEQLLGFGRK